MSRINFNASIFFSIEHLPWASDFQGLIPLQQVDRIKLPDAIQIHDMLNYFQGRVFLRAFTPKRIFRSVFIVCYRLRDSGQERHRLLRLSRKSMRPLWIKKMPVKDELLHFQTGLVRLF
jgi:hypothetical protein